MGTALKFLIFHFPPPPPFLLLFFFFFQTCFRSYIRPSYSSLLFSHKIFLPYSFLRESRKELTPKIENMEQMQKEGKDYASKVFHTIAEATGETLTVEQLKEEVQKKKESKVCLWKGC